MTVQDLAPAGPLSTIGIAPARTAVPQALWGLAAGRVVVLTGRDRAELILAAQDVRPRELAFMIRHSSGFLTVAMTGEDCARLGLPPVRGSEPGSLAAGACVSVDAATGITTGISARDRARTVSALADANSTDQDLNRPGHVVPVRIHPRGVLGRRSHHEASVELASLAGLRPAAVSAALVSARRPAELAAGSEILEFADEHALALVSVDDVVAYRRAHQGDHPLPAAGPGVCPVRGERWPGQRGVVLRRRL